MAIAVNGHCSSTTHSWTTATKGRGRSRGSFRVTLRAPTRPGPAKIADWSGLERGVDHVMRTRKLGTALAKHPGASASMSQCPSSSPPLSRSSITRTRSPTSPSSCAATTAHQVDDFIGRLTAALTQSEQARAEAEQRMNDAQRRLRQAEQRIDARWSRSSPTPTSSSRRTAGRPSPASAPGSSRSCGSPRSRPTTTAARPSGSPRASSPPPASRPARSPTRPAPRPPR